MLLAKFILEQLGPEIMVVIDKFCDQIHSEKGASMFAWIYGCGIGLHDKRIHWSGCKFPCALLELLERYPKVRVCCDSVELFEEIAGATRDWGLRNMNERFRHVRRMEIAEVGTAWGRRGHELSFI